MKRIIHVVLIVFILFLSACATNKYNPFKVTPEEINNTIHTIVIRPTKLPADLPNQQSLRNNFEPSIESFLKDAGFKIITPNDVSPIWEKYITDAGGFYDPVTGDFNDTKFKSINGKFEKDIVAKYNADAILFPVVRVYSVDWRNGIATWDGTWESVKSVKENVAKILTMTVDYSSGKIGALSLSVNLYDKNNKCLYLNSGGIQLVSKVSFGKFERVPNEELCNDKDLDDKAVRIALEPLRDKLQFMVKQNSK